MCGASSEQQEVCLSPLSQYFCNVEQPPDIYAIMTLDGYCTLEELVKPMQHMADLHDRCAAAVVDHQHTAVLQAAVVRAGVQPACSAV